MDVLQILKDYLAEENLPNTKAVIAGFRNYMGLLKQGNRTMNLIGPLPEAEIVTDLFCDSLSLAALLKPLPSVVIDIGSGAGLPGIPLKLLQPDIALHLVEPRQKRHYFLGLAIRTLGLQNVTRHNARIEDCAHALPPNALVCSKAFAPVDQWLPLAASLCGPQGFIGVLCTADHWTPAIDALAASLSLSILHRRSTPRPFPHPPRLTLILTPASPTT